MFYSRPHLRAVLVTLLEAHIKVQVCVYALFAFKLLHHTNLTSSGEEGWNENIKRKISLIPCFFMWPFVKCEMLHYCCAQAIKHELSNKECFQYMFLPVFNITMCFF